MAVGKVWMEVLEGARVGFTEKKEAEDCLSSRPKYGTSRDISLWFSSHQSIHPLWFRCIWDFPHRTENKFIYICIELTIFHHRIELVLEGHHHLFQVWIFFFKVFHLPLQRGVLLLKEARSHRDLILLQTTSLSRPLCSLIVFTPLCPILIVLQLVRNKLLFSLSNNRLWFQLLLWEPPCCRVKVLQLKVCSTEAMLWISVNDRLLAKLLKKDF